MLVHLTQSALSVLVRFFAPSEVARIDEEQVEQAKQQARKLEDTVTALQARINEFDAETVERQKEFETKRQAFFEEYPALEKSEAQTASKSACLWLITCCSSFACCFASFNLVSVATSDCSVCFICAFKSAKCISNSAIFCCQILSLT